MVQLFYIWHLAIAQLVERRTVESKEAILRSLVRIRFARIFFFLVLFSFSFFFFAVVVVLSAVCENMTTVCYFLLMYHYLSQEKLENIENVQNGAGEVQIFITTSSQIEIPAAADNSHWQLRDLTQTLRWKVAWPSGLRRWFKAPVSSGAWVRIPPLPYFLATQDTW